MSGRLVRSFTAIVGVVRPVENARSSKQLAVFLLQYQLPGGFSGKRATAVGAERAAARNCFRGSFDSFIKFTAILGTALT
jgi:hypothetical protein